MSMNLRDISVFISMLLSPNCIIEGKDSANRMKCQKFLSISEAPPILDCVKDSANRMISQIILNPILHLFYTFGCFLL